jgi:hypothetical protein
MDASRMKLYPESSYTKVINDIGPYHYQIFEENDALPDEVFKNQLSILQYNCVFACSGATTADYHISLETTDGYQDIGNITVPKGHNILVVRLLRHCEHDGTPHFNADDQVIFPATNGNVYRLSRNDAPDHYVALVRNAGIQDVASAYNLPDDKYGHIDHYSYKGASLHVEINPLKDKSL